jgi:hypothetical protein
VYNYAAVIPAWLFLTCESNVFSTSPLAHTLGTRKQRVNPNSDFSSYHIPAPIFSFSKSEVIISPVVSVKNLAFYLSLLFLSYSTNPVCSTSKMYSNLATSPHSYHMIQANIRPPQFEFTPVSLQTTFYVAARVRITSGPYSQLLCGISS